MRILKKVITTTLAAAGYRLNRLSEPRVSLENFANLAQAYEQRINESIDQVSSLLANELRPKLLSRLLGTPPSEAYFIIQALAQCRNLYGDVCEFGVAQGETSAVIANEIAKSTNKNLHLFDSFEGLPKPTEKDQLKDDIYALGSLDAYTGLMSYPEDMVRARMEAISFPAQRYVIHKGFIEKLIHNDKNLPEAVCFAYVDFDFYEPIKIALEYLHKVMPSGAMIVVDDYNFFSTGAKTAVDEFVAEQNSKGIIYECLVPDTRYGYFAVLTKRR
jgi:O-methyltransferase